MRRFSFSWGRTRGRWKAREYGLFAPFPNPESIGIRWRRDRVENEAVSDAVARRSRRDALLIDEPLCGRRKQEIRARPLADPIRCRSLSSLTRYDTQGRWAKRIWVVGGFFAGPVTRRAGCWSEWRSGA